ncbi:hypothetical protein [Deinococcus sp. UR1]|uniref:hypothetical protein n=1 Tax=Deinococcus sp. UR1 TaxID=1704277 RepID=UPI000C193B4E|nr:hypothetical protein [Deinococcus sp. UR1]PIG96911.1 hypothetical protein AMD26_015410 [Deinococcus sp. UR1]
MKDTPKEARQKREARLDAIHALARREEVNLPDLAARMQLSLPYTWGLLQSLLRRRMIVRAGTRASTRGKPATTFKAAA